MRPSLRLVLFTLLAFTSHLAAQPAAQPAATPAVPPATQPVVSPFDKDDPEVQRILRLNWKTVKFEELDARHQMAAYFAMNKGLSIMGTKADARLDLLIDYVEANKLGEAVADAASTIPPPPDVSFEDYKKMGAAFVRSPDGSVKVDAELGTIPEDMIPAYVKLYQNSSMRSFAEVVESRHQVRLIAAYLQEEGKFEDFKKWSADEKRRRQEAYAKELAEKRVAAAEAEKIRREQAIAAAQERQKQEAEERARRMEYAMQQQASQPSGGGVSYDHDGYWGDSWYPYSGAYYAGALYRSQVRDRASNSWSRWRANAGSRPRPTPRRR